MHIISLKIIGKQPDFGSFSILKQKKKTLSRNEKVSFKMIIEWHSISKEIFVPDCFRKRTRSQRLQIINVLRTVKLYELS